MFTHIVQGTHNTNFDSNIPTAFHMTLEMKSEHKQKIQDGEMSTWPHAATFFILYTKNKTQCQ
jgi:hypothetical protein